MVIGMHWEMSDVRRANIGVVVTQVAQGAAKGSRISQAGRGGL
jgi:hypothetical protein